MLYMTQLPAHHNSFKKSIALIDCNSFYASCERIFKPKLLGKPIVVLSNNDGCIITRSKEAKLLGIKMGEPYFKAKKIIKDNNVKVFSSNYSLYGDISQRVMEILLGFSWVGIPVSIGLGPTKTLSKIANHMAKKYEFYRGVCILKNEKIIDQVLKKTEISDIWGIGKKISKFLKSYNINNAKQFTNDFAMALGFYGDVNLTYDSSCKAGVARETPALLCSKNDVTVYVAGNGNIGKLTTAVLGNIKSPFMPIEPLYIIIGVVAIGGVIGAIAVAKRGSKTPKPAKEEAPKEEPKKETSGFCENCGNSLKPTTKFCGRCGTQV